MKGIFSEKFFRRIGFYTIASILFLIFIGGLVRITGSGMGCPDWPKCFGYYIPPTEPGQLTWTPGKEYKKGQMIINNERLLVAKSNFTTGNTFDEAQWEVYTKHDYAKFNALHTYIEWGNRMVSVFVGIFMVLMVISSFQYWETRKSIVVLSLLSFFLTLFQAWIGAKVVESNLDAFKISIHMLVALAIVGFVMLAVYKDHAAAGLHRVKNIRLLKGLVYGLIVLTFLQVFLGTQVREKIDTYSVPSAKWEPIEYLWPEFFDDVLNPHKTLALVVLIIALAIFARLRNKVEKSNRLYRFAVYSLALVLLQIATGTLNIFMQLPPVVQLLHVTLSGLLAGSLFYMAILLHNYKSETGGEVLEK